MFGNLTSRDVAGIGRILKHANSTAFSAEQAGDTGTVTPEGDLIWTRGGLDPKQIDALGSVLDLSIKWLDDDLFVIGS